MSPRRSTTTRATTCLAVAAAGALALAACGSGGGFEDDGGADGETATGGDGGSLTVLIGSSGDAETTAVTDAVAAWSSDSGTEAEVVVAADLPQQIAQGFAANDPPDVFYLGTEIFAGYAANGSLYPYVDELEGADDFYPTLLESFTYDGTPYCAPKDFSTLALVINTDSWEAAGLTDGDLPTTWDELREVATTLTTDTQTGLSFGAEWQRIGTFMAQAGGGLVDTDGTVIADSPENLEALTYVQELLASGVVAYPGDIGAGWGGEALGNGAAAMVIEGNWIVGAMTNDFPDVAYRVAELPEGPAGPGTLQFTNCWAVAEGGNTGAAVDLVEYLTSGEQQMAFATAFGVMPSVQSVGEEWTSTFPEQEAFLAGADHAQGFPVIEDVLPVINDLNSQLIGLETGDPQAMLASTQTNLEAIAP